MPSVPRRNTPSFNWSTSSVRRPHPPSARGTNWSRSISLQKNCRNKSFHIREFRSSHGTASQHVNTFLCRHPTQDLEVSAQVHANQRCRTDPQQEKTGILATSHQLLETRLLYRVRTEDLSYNRCGCEAHRRRIQRHLPHHQHHASLEETSVHMAQSTPSKWVCSRHV